MRDWERDFSIPTARDFRFFFDDFLLGVRSAENDEADEADEGRARGEVDENVSWIFGDSELLLLTEVEWLFVLGKEGCSSDVLFGRAKLSISSSSS